MRPPEGLQVSSARIITCPFPAVLTGRSRVTQRWAASRVPCCRPSAISGADEIQTAELVRPCRKDALARGSSVLACCAPKGTVGSNPTLSVASFKRLSGRRPTNRLPQTERPDAQAPACDGNENDPTDEPGIGGGRTPPHDQLRDVPDGEEPKDRARRQEIGFHIGPFS